MSAKLIYAIGVSGSREDSLTRDARERWLRGIHPVPFVVTALVRPTLAAKTMRP